jgi:polyhydroxyalkanoate synthase
LVLWILEQLYLKNALVSESRMQLAGQSIDLSAIDCPTFLLATESDDISPWQSVMMAADRFGVEPVCVLGQGGHNAGVISPPTKQRHDHYRLDSSDWLNKTIAVRSEGSWWLTWNEFLEKQQGPSVSPPAPGGGIRPVIEEAPGRYVKQS